MSEWILVDADLSRYHSTKFKAGGRLYFLKAGRKNVSLKLSAIPKFYYTPEEFTFGTHHFSTKTWKSILKDFRGYTKKTRNEKDILDTLKKINRKKS